MTLSEFNSKSRQEAEQLMEQCCAATRWVSQMVAQRPYDNVAALLNAADEIWSQMAEPDWLAAFKAHPKIGDIKSLSEKYANTKAIAQGEQASTGATSPEVLSALAAKNTEYFDKFGFIFIVCATGKSAQQMLDLLCERLPNDRQTELNNAAAEQGKITQLRLQKLFNQPSSQT